MAAFLSKNMENVISMPRLRSISGSFRAVGLDTALVLVFLAMDLGGSFGSVDFGTILSLLTILAFVVFPYFLTFEGERPPILGWITGRLIVAVTGIVAGMGLNVLAEVYLMENLKYLPMTLLIFSGIFCAITQIRDIIRFRLAS
jgi:hypothetical protein